jgi:hypothetical protein
LASINSSSTKLKETLTIIFSLFITSETNLFSVKSFTSFIFQSSIKDKRKKGELTAQVAERLFKTAGSISGAAFQKSLPINTVMQRYPALCKKYGVGFYQFVLN